MSYVGYEVARYNYGSNIYMQTHIYIYDTDKVEQPMILVYRGKAKRDGKNLSALIIRDLFFAKKYTLINLYFTVFSFLLNI